MFTLGTEVPLSPKRHIRDGRKAVSTILSVLSDILGTGSHSVVQAGLELTSNSW